MSRNYTTYSKGTSVNKTNQKPELFGENKATPNVVKTTVDEIGENAAEVILEDTNTKNVNGVVANCKRLNVRRSPSKSSQSVKIIDEGTVVNIDEEKSTVNFYKVSGDGFDGYCMREFILVN